MSKKKKYVAVVVFGEYAENHYEEGFRNLGEWLEDQGRLVKREFDTEAERNAYLTGIEDMDGWWGCVVLSDEEIAKHPKFINKHAQ